MKASSIEELARMHIGSIRVIQAHGPYRLAGFSFGGVIALEIAQQLRAAGEEIELLFLLDPSRPYQIGGMAGEADEAPESTGIYESTGSWVQRHALKIARRPHKLASYISQRRNRLPFWPWIRYKILHLHGRNPNALTTWLLPKDQWPAFLVVFRRLGKSYVARPYEGKVIAVFIEYQDQWPVWKRLLGVDVDVTFVEWNHMDLFTEPAAKEWQHALRAGLGEKQ